MSALRSFLGAGARTDPRAEDPALRGRTYAIAYDRVWHAARDLAGGGPGALARWSLVEADDQSGNIVAEAQRRLRRSVDEVRIRIGLDENAQTRVDLEARPRDGGMDLGANRRRIRGFLRALDEKLAAAPTQILQARPLNFAP